MQTRVMGEMDQTTLRPEGDQYGPTIALLLDHIETDYHVEMIESALRVAERRGARTLIIPGGALNSEGAPGHRRGYIYNYLAIADIQGLMIFGGTLSNYSGIAGFERFYRQLPRLPAVVVGLDTPSAPCVAVNNHHGVCQLVDHLVYEHGRRNIAFIEGPSGSTESRIRRQAYLDSMERHQLHADSRYLIPGGLGREQGIDAIVTLFEDRHLTPPEVDALVCVNDEVALGAMEELARRRIRVPEQLSVVGFDDTPNAHAALPALTTVSQRVYEQAEVAMSRVLDAIERGGFLSRDELLPNLRIRSSCGCRTPMSNDSGRNVPAPENRERMEQQGAWFEQRIHSVARGRIKASEGWERALTKALMTELNGNKGALTTEFANLSHVVGETGMDVCHELLTELRLQSLGFLVDEDPRRTCLEDGFQEARLVLANRAMFYERERQSTHTLYLRAITRACLNRAQGGDLDELAVSLEEQLPMVGLKHFVVSRGDEDVLEVVARSAGSQETGGETVTTAQLGRNRQLVNKAHVVVMPLSARKKQVGLAAFGYGGTDPFLFEQLRDLLGMALGVDDSSDDRETDSDMAQELTGL